MLNSRLRSYQREAIEAVLKAILQGHHAGLLVMPTGVGKTFLFVELARLLGLPTLILVHRDELVRQTVETVQTLWPTIRVGVVKAARNEWDGPQVVVASVQSLNKRRLEKIPTDRFGLVVVDEAHHSPAVSWSRAIGWFTKGFLLGVTATPDRLDGKGLANSFGPKPLYVYMLHKAIRDGYLVDLASCKIETETDLDGIDIKAGDFVKDQLAKRVNDDARNNTVVESYRKHAAQRRAVVFCVDVDHTYAMADAFAAAGIPATAVTGKTDPDERREILKDFAEGRWRVLANCQILTEGFDDPDIDCVIMARPTKSRALYTQCIGRGLRLPWLNVHKKNCLVLDITDNCRRHKLVCATDLMPKEKDPAGEQPGPGGPRQQPALDAVVTVVSWRLEQVCPWPEVPSLNGYLATAPWHNDQASEKQVAVLRRLGLELNRPLTKGEASWLIDRCMAYEEAFPTPATDKQEYYLRYAGEWREGMSKKEASAMIARLKAAERTGQLTASSCAP